MVAHPYVGFEQFVLVPQFLNVGGEFIFAQCLGEVELPFEQNVIGNGVVHEFLERLHPNGLEHFIDLFIAGSQVSKDKRISLHRVCVCEDTKILILSKTYWP